MNSLQQFGAFELHISLGSEALLTVGSFKITNAFVTGVLGLIIFLTVFIYTAQMVKRRRYNRFVGLVQWAFEGMLSQVYSVISDRKMARKIAPLSLTIFFFVLISYWLSVIPGLESITYHGTPVLRSLAADLNFTLAIMLITMVTVQVYAIRRHGLFGNAGRYLRNPFKDPLGAFEGFLELIGEVSRGLALALRLFGNCFAGEVLLIIIAVLTSYLSVVALPIFMAFELFIGLVQAYVFFILSLIFTSLAVDTHTSHPEPTTVEHSPTDHAPTPVVSRE